MGFYQTAGAYTDPKLFRQLLQALPDNHAEIVALIRKVLIHPIDARNSGVRFDYKKVLRSQVDHRSVDDILANPKVSALLSLNTLDVQSEPAQRGILSCDHYAALFASILRLKHQAVRARCGYATYLVPEKLTPHWVCEVYDEGRRQWAYIDPEQARIGVEDGAFVLAGAVWLEARRGAIDLEHVLPDYRSGLDGVKYRLLNDVNALMKHELLNYDWMIREAAPKAPKLFSKPVAKLDEAEYALLDSLAALSLDVDARWDRLREQYATYVHPEHVRAE